MVKNQGRISAKEMQASRSSFFVKLKNIETMRDMKIHQSGVLSTILKKRLESSLSWTK